MNTKIFIFILLGSALTLSGCSDPKLKNNITEKCYTILGTSLDDCKCLAEKAEKSLEKSEIELFSKDIDDYKNKDYTMAHAILQSIEYKYADKCE